MSKDKVIQDAKHDFEKTLTDTLQAFGGNVTGLNLQAIQDAIKRGQDPEFLKTVKTELIAMKSRMHTVAYVLLGTCALMALLWFILLINNLIGSAYILYLQWLYFGWIPLVYLPCIVSAVYAFYPPSKIGEGVRIYNIVIAAIGAVGFLIGVGAVTRLTIMARQCAAVGWVASSALPPVGIFGDHTGMCAGHLQFWINILIGYFTLVVHMIAFPILMGYLVLDQDRYLHHRVVRKLGSIGDKWLSYSVAQSGVQAQITTQYSGQIGCNYPTMGRGVPVHYSPVYKEDPNSIQHYGHFRLRKLAQNLMRLGYAPDLSFVGHQTVYKYGGYNQQ